MEPIRRFDLADSEPKLVASAKSTIGPFVVCEPIEFQNLLARCETPIIVCAEKGMLTKTFQYLTSYRGLVFYTESGFPIEMPTQAEVVSARQIVMPK